MAKRDAVFSSELLGLGPSGLLSSCGIGYE